MDLFFGGATYLLILEELDNYSNRQGSMYYGPPYRDEKGVGPSWPTDELKRVFVYLYPDAPVLPMLILGLDQLGISTVIYTGSTTPGHLSSMATQNIAFTDRPFALTEPATSCDLVVCQGGGNTMATALLQGIPLLTYPRHIEAKMACLRLKSQGLAEILNNTNDQAAIKQSIMQCLNNDTLRQRAGEFAFKYRNFNGKQVARLVAEEISQGKSQ